MRQRDLFWCGAVLSALAVFICLRSIQQPLYAGIGGILCALMAAVLFGFGLRTDAREKSDSESKRREEADRVCRSDRAALREWLDVRQQSDAAALGKIQAEITAVTRELETLCGVIVTEGQSRSKTMSELSEDMRSGFASGQKQTGESAKTICDSILALHNALRQSLESQSRQTENYRKFMIDQPWAEIRTLSETLRSTAEQISDIWSLVESIHTNTERQMKKMLVQLTEDNESLQEKLQHVCEAVERQSKEHIEAMDRMIQSYSDITAQDMEVLTTLAREEVL